MKTLLTCLILLIAAFVSVFPLIQLQRENGVFDPLLRWWKSATGVVRIAAVAFLLSFTAIGSDKLLGSFFGGLMGRVSPTNTFTVVEQSTGYALASVGTNEVHDFTMPTNAVVADRIAKRGAHDDDFRTQDGGLWILTDGTAAGATWSRGSVTLPPCPQPQTSNLELQTSNLTVFAVAQGSYGFLPQSLWGEYGTSCIWTAENDAGTKLVTWEGALVNRLPADRATFQAEFAQNSNVVYRYSAFPSNAAAGIFCNGATLTPDLATNTTSVSLAYIGDLTDGAGDTDGDGLTDWEEVMRYGTDPREADTDGDGLPDGDDNAPLNCDADGDGLPDGVSPAVWNANLLFGANAGCTNVVVTVLDGMAAFPGDPGVPGAAVLDVNGLKLPVMAGRTYELALPSGEYLPYKLFNAGSLPVKLEMTSPSGEAIWLEDRGHFSGRSLFGNISGRMALPKLELLPIGDCTGPCVHEQPGYRDFSVSLMPLAWDIAAGHATLSGFTLNDDGTLRLTVADEPRSVASGEVTFSAPYLHAGALCADAAIHRCEYPVHGSCPLCGDGHDTTGLSMDIERGRYRILCNSTFAVPVRLSPASTGPANWSISPSSPVGPRLYSSPEGGEGHERLSGVSEVWVRGGAAPGSFTITARHPEAEDVQDTATIGVFCCEFEPVTTEMIDGYVNPAFCAVGGKAQFYVHVYPSDVVSDEDIHWRVQPDSFATLDTDTGAIVSLSPVSEGECVLSVEIDDYDGPKPSTPCRAVTETTTPIRAVVIVTNGVAAAQADDIRDMVAEVNEIYRQVGMRFVLESVAFTNMSPTEADGVNPEDEHFLENALSLCNSMTNTGGLEVYFVFDLGDDHGGNVGEPGNAYGILLASGATGKILAHEIGHSCGLEDIYLFPMLDSPPGNTDLRYDWLPGDWGSESQDVHYYSQVYTQDDIIHQLLMHGVIDTNGRNAENFNADISSGDVFGAQRNEDDSGYEAALVPVGFVGHGTRTPRHL